MPNKYRLGQQVTYKAIMYRHKGSTEATWQRAPVSGAGIIVGKRTMSDGYTSYHPDEGHFYHPTKHHSFWLVAHNLSGYRYVAEKDLEPAADRVWPNELERAFQPHEEEVNGNTE